MYFEHQQIGDQDRVCRSVSCCTLVLFALWLFSAPSKANVYRCVSDDGIVTYSDEPCGAGVVAAGQAYKMRVDEAAARPVIHSATNRRLVSRIEADMKAHAEVIGACILPDLGLASVTVKKAGDHRLNEDLDWLFSTYFGAEGYEREWRIEVFYRGKMGNVDPVWLHKIRIFRNNKPFEPSTMQNLKRFRQIEVGEWEFLRP